MSKNHTVETVVEQLMTYAKGEPVNRIALFNNLANVAREVQSSTEFQEDHRMMNAMHQYRNEME